MIVSRTSHSKSWRQCKKGNISYANNNGNSFYKQPLRVIKHWQKVGFTAGVSPSLALHRVTRYRSVVTRTSDWPQHWRKLNLAFSNVKFKKGPFMLRVQHMASGCSLVFHLAGNLNIHSAIVHHVHGPLLNNNKKREQIVRKCNMNVCTCRLHFKVKRLFTLLHYIKIFCSYYK